MKLYLGIDVGSQSVRVSIISHSKLLVTKESPITIRRDPNHPDFITQDINEIWNGIDTCIRDAVLSLNDLGYSHASIELRGIGCVATCSMVVVKRLSENDKLLFSPYPVDFNHADEKQNIVMWMDSRSKREAKEIGTLISSLQDSEFGDKVLRDAHSCFSSGLSPELAIPKLKNLYNSIPESDKDDIVFFDLHDYIIYLLATNNVRGKKLTTVPIDIDYSTGEVGIDGSLKGWSRRFFESLSLGGIAKENFKSIGRLERLEAAHKDEYLGIPFAGEPLGYVSSDLLERWGIPNEKIAIGSGLIDCYGGWVPCAYDTSSDSRLVIIGGTSTCFLVTQNNHEVAPMGIWGPFNTLIRNRLFYEGGLSTSGILFENLFANHPGFKEIESQSKLDGVSHFVVIDRLIDRYVVEGKLQNEYLLSFDKFFCGDLAGNRTPYNMPYMTGMYIGETLNHDIRDFVSRYLCILEYLAFETKKFIDVMHGNGILIDDIVITGSQALNSRLCELVSIVCGIPVSTANNSKHSAVIGAAMLGILADDRLSNTSHSEFGSLSVVHEVKVDLTSKRSIFIKEMMMKKLKIINKMVDLQLEAIDSMMEYR